MRVARTTLIALAALAVLATPAFAKNTKAQQADTEEDASPPCTSYQLGPDGDWVPLPCRELGTNSSTQHRAPAKSRNESR